MFLYVLLWEEFIIVFKNVKMKFYNDKYLLCKMIKINFN